MDYGNSIKATVMKYNGSSWVNVGSAGFSAGEAYYTSLALDASGTPYVAYEDNANSNKATVMKFNGSSWVTVGSAGFSAGEAYSTSLALDASGTPYVAYGDTSNSWKATVMKYNGSSWVTVGSAGFSAGQAYYTSLALDASGTPYVAYQDDGGTDTKATVMKYNGSSWVNVGSAGFSAGEARSTSLELDASGTPFVAYKESGNSEKATVMKYGALALANDDFGTPVTINSVPYTNSQDTTTATTAVDDPNFQCGSYTTGTNSVWYTFTPSQNGTLTASTEYTNFDTVLALWTGTRGSLTSIACNDDYGGIMYSQVDVPVQAGVQYFIEVAGYKSLTSPPPAKEWKDADPSPNPAGASSGTLYLSVSLAADPIIQTLTFQSVGANDGWVLESSETSGVGGALDTAATTFRLGDNNQKKQYRGILSFSTGAGLPDTAIITKVTLKFKRQGITGGGNPVTTFQGFMVDIKKGFFGTTALQITDFQAAAPKTYGPFVTALSGGWYSIDLTPGKGYINKISTLSGLTQIRLRFKLDDNNNAVANYLSLYSGNAGAASRPQLIIEYYVP